MKVISTGSKFDIYPDDLRSYDKLPAGYYVVRFNPKVGFFLEKYSEFQMTEAKVYGIHEAKVNKVLSSFNSFNRNLGVILSGDKGIGKSLFARMLGQKAVENDIPVIIVEGYIDGIGSFIDKIEQEVMVLFDEFDKTFSTNRDDGVNPQANMLSLFDGVAQGKKLFVVTCNELRGLNGFLINRPGRFHYHFRFDYPTAEDIKEYLLDKLEADKQAEIDNVIDFSKRVALNFDCLRAIAFELNLGQTFAEAIQDLNIINIEKEVFKVIATFSDGTVLLNKNVQMDSFGDEAVTVSFRNTSNDYVGEIIFRPNQLRLNTINGDLYLEPEDVTIDYDSYYEEEEEEKAKKEALEKKGLKQVVVHRIQDNKLHYAV